MELMKWAFGRDDDTELSKLNMDCISRRWRTQHPDKKDVGEMTLREASLYIVGEYCKALKQD